MNPKSTSAADSMLARTGRRIAVSESFICASFLRKVNRPDGPQRNGTSHARVPSLSCLYVERERGQSTLAGPVCVRTEGPEHTPKRGRPARGALNVITSLSGHGTVRVGLSRRGGLAEWLRHRS